MFGVFNITWWILPVGVVVGFIVGMLWYGPIFGKQWMKAANMSEQQVSGGMGAGLIVGTIVTSAILTYVIGVIVNVMRLLGSGTTYVFALIILGVIWIGFIGAIRWNHMSFEGQAKSLWPIHSFYDLIVIAIVATLFWFFG